MTREYKVVGMYFNDNVPDLTTAEELIPLNVVSKDDVEYLLDREITDLEWEQIKDKARELDLPDQEDMIEWFSEEVLDEWEAEKREERIKKKGGRK